MLGRSSPLLVLLALLSGCVGAPDETLPAALQEEAEGNDTPAALPDNRTGEFAAFKETNVTSTGAHQHDSWGGRTRIEIVNERVAMEPLPEGGGAYAIVRPPEGVDHLVFEGTATLELTLFDPQRRACALNAVVNGDYVCTPPLADPRPPAAVAVDYLHAASDPDAWVGAGEAAWGQPLVISLAGPTWTDMPHSTSSLWVFRFRTPDPQDTTLAFGLSVTAVRMEGEIPEWPGHPDFYAQASERVVMEARGAIRDSPLVGWSYGEASPTKLVSAGTRTLHVFVNVTSLEGPLKPTHWLLYFHNASGRTWNITEWFREDRSVDRTSLAWTIAVDDNAMDTPYGTRSRWEILVRGIQGNCLGGCADYEAVYDIRVVASALPAARYDEVYKWVPR